MRPDDFLAAVEAKGNDFRSVGRACAGHAKRSKGVAAPITAALLGVLLWRWRRRERVPLLQAAHAWG
jgi:hypothetical protein